MRFRDWEEGELNFHFDTHLMEQGIESFAPGKSNQRLRVGLLRAPWTFDIRVMHGVLQEWKRWLLNPIYNVGKKDVTLLVVKRI